MTTPFICTMLYLDASYVIINNYPDVADNNCTVILFVCELGM